MAAMIPLRPANYVSSLPQPEQSALTWFVISGCSKKDAYMLFARPEMALAKTKASVDGFLNQFFSRVEVREYLDAYRKTLEDFLHPAAKPVKSKGSLEERKAVAKAKAVEFAIALADNIDQADDPEAVLKLMDKVGLLDGDEEVVEQPRRYLPESCGNCRYRAFCEDNTEDLCQLCKYRRYGEEHGIHYDTNCQLVSGTEIEKQQ